MTVLWKKTDLPVDYSASQVLMEQHVTKMIEVDEPELIWFLEHPSLYTIGSSGHQRDILMPGEIPSYETGRGGQITYHGPGQRVGYVMLNLKKRHLDLRQYVHKLETWLIDALQHWGVQGQQRAGRIGVWIASSTQENALEAKIAAIGIRIRKGIAFHGFALNVAPDLTYFQKIVPCGLKNYGVTSLQDLGVHLSLEEVDQVLQEKFPYHFP